jgi:hypothetical protein
MALLTVSDILKIFESCQQWIKGSHDKSDDAVIEWLEAVQRDLEGLAKTWIKITAEIEADCLRPCGRWEVLEYFGDQTRGSSKLREFYYSASSVIGEKVPSSFHQDFLDMLGACLYERNTSRSIVDRRMSILALDPSTKFEDFTSYSAASNALQREIAALEVLIVNFKTQTKLRR